MWKFQTKAALRQQIADLEAENAQLQVERYEESLHWLTQPGNYRRFKEHNPDMAERLIQHLKVGKAPVVQSRALGRSTTTGSGLVSLRNGVVL